MAYEVIAKKRARYHGFRRSGIFFPDNQAVTLSNDEITPAILAEPMLIVTEIPEAEAEPKALEDMTIAELKDFAKLADIEIPEKITKKADILAVIQAAVARLEAEKKPEEE